MKRWDFKQRGIVRKIRWPGDLNWGKQRVTVALDQVEGLGTFLELEIQATESSLEQARTDLQGLAGTLNLGQGERRSYLELLAQ